MTSLTPNQLHTLQEALSAIALDEAWKDKIIVVPLTLPDVGLLIQGSTAWLECTCGWRSMLHEGQGMTGYSLTALDTFARHDCLGVTDEA